MESTSDKGFHSIFIIYQVSTNYFLSHSQFFQRLQELRFLPSTSSYLQRPDHFLAKGKVPDPSIGD